MKGRCLWDLVRETTDPGNITPSVPTSQLEKSRPQAGAPHLQEYMWFFLTLLRKKPLHPSQLEAP